MKKLFFVLLSILLILGTYIIEGGAISSLLCISSFIPVFLGTLISTAFTFGWSEIKETFQDAFSEYTIAETQERYSRDLQLVRCMSVSIMFWAGSIIILAIMGILSSVTHLNELGPHIAVAFTALLYGFAARSILFIPMESNLNRKLIQCERMG